MIIGKKRVLSLCLVIAICAVSLCACSERGDDNAFDLLEAMKEKAEEQTEQVTYEKYLIIIPAKSTSALSLIARDLAEKIEQKTGVDCEYKYDNADIQPDDKRLDILLGNTNRRVSADVLGRFKNDDYICKYSDGYLVLGGLSDAATVTAVQRFIDEILPSVTENKFIPSGLGFEYYGEYEIKDVLLCGYDIRDYTIVFSGLEAQTMATALRDLLARQSGIYIDVKAGTANINAEKEIYLSIDPLSNVCARRVGEDVYIVGNDTYSLSCAISETYGMLLAGEKDGKVSLDISGCLEFSCSSDLLRISSILADGAYNNDGNVGVLSAFAQAVNESTDEVVVLGKMDRDVWSSLNIAINASYGFAVLEAEDGVVPIAYLREAVRVVNAKMTTVDSVTVAQLDIEHIASEERYALCVFVDEDTVYQSVVETIHSSDNSLAMVCIPERSDNTVTPDNGVSVVYNGVISLSNNSYRLLWEAVYPDLICKNVSSINVEDVSCVSFDVGNRYCAAYRQLMS